ncbi:MAG: TonB family protein [Phycisphaerae bacterium]|nr:TonB family protein [Phycisphaerae bacterium]
MAILGPAAGAVTPRRAWVVGVALSLAAHAALVGAVRFAALSEADLAGPGGDAARRATRQRPAPDEPRPAPRLSARPRRRSVTASDRDRVIVKRRARRRAPRPSRIEPHEIPAIPVEPPDAQETRREALRRLAQLEPPRKRPLLPRSIPPAATRKRAADAPFARGPAAVLTPADPSGGAPQVATRPAPETRPVAAASTTRPVAPPMAQTAAAADSGEPPGAQTAAPARPIRPAYPPPAVRRGREGRVVVAAYVLADGTVGSARVQHSSGFGVLDAAAVRAVRTATFIPARRGGAPVAEWVRIPIRFVLERR